MSQEPASSDTREHNSFTSMFLIENIAHEEKRKRIFSAMSGIQTGVLGWKNRFDIFEAQRQKIIGLKTQMKQMHRGYRKKIDRLGFRIHQLEQLLIEEKGKSS